MLRICGAGVGTSDILMRMQADPRGFGCYLCDSLQLAFVEALSSRAMFTAISNKLSKLISAAAAVTSISAKAARLPASAAAHRRWLAIVAANVFAYESENREINIRMSAGCYSSGLKKHRNGPIIVDSSRDAETWRRTKHDIRVAKRRLFPAFVNAAEEKA